jgi:hypothetical protein
MQVRETVRVARGVRVDLRGRVSRGLVLRRCEGHTATKLNRVYRPESGQGLEGFSGSLFVDPDQTGDVMAPTRPPFHKLRFGSARSMVRVICVRVAAILARISSNEPSIQIERIRGPVKFEPRHRYYKCQEIGGISVFSKSWTAALKRKWCVMVRRIVATAALLAANIVALPAWHNGGDKDTADPRFGTHDYIAFKALDRAPAADVAFIRTQLRAYFVGTEAPDTAKTVAGIPKTGYHDSGPCHCILFDEEGQPTRLRAAERARQEFDKAAAALHAGQKQKAALFAGTLAHYVGDLSQFCHVMGKQSHWGAEDQTIHKAYENVLNRTIDFRARTTSLLETFLKPVPVEGDTLEEIVEGVAQFTENGGGTPERPGVMIKQLAKLKKAGMLNDPNDWDSTFRDQTGANVNYAINAIGKLLHLLAVS